MKLSHENRFCPHDNNSYHACFPLCIVVTDLEKEENEIDSL